MEQGGATLGSAPRHTVQHLRLAQVTLNSVTECCWAASCIALLPYIGGVQRADRLLHLFALCWRLRLQSLDRVQDPVPYLAAGHVACVDMVIGE